MSRLMRISLVTFVISLGAWVLLGVFEAVFGVYLEGRYLYYAPQLRLAVQLIAIDLAVVSGLVMLALLVHVAWQRLGREHDERVTMTELTTKGDRGQ